MVLQRALHREIQSRVPGLLLLALYRHHALVSGSVASLLSAAALTGRRETHSAAAPSNAVGHWYWSHRALWQQHVDASTRWRGTPPTAPRCSEPPCFRSFWSGSRPGLSTDALAQPSPRPTWLLPQAWGWEPWPHPPPLGFLTPRTGNGQPPSKRQPFPPPAAMVKDVLELLPQGMRALGSRCFRQPMQIGRGARS